MRNATRLATGTRFDLESEDSCHAPASQPRADSSKKALRSRPGESIRVGDSAGLPGAGRVQLEERVERRVHVFGRLGHGQARGQPFPLQRVVAVPERLFDVALEARLELVPAGWKPEHVCRLGAPPSDAHRPLKGRGKRGCRLQALPCDPVPCVASLQACHDGPCDLRFIRRIDDGGALFGDVLIGSEEGERARAKRTERRTLGEHERNDADELSGRPARDLDTQGVPHERLVLPERLPPREEPFRQLER